MNLKRSTFDCMFSPRSVAVIGATDREGSVGRTLLLNLMNSDFQGAVFPVNPKRSTVLGLRAYSSVAALPEKADLAVIATPAPSVPQVIRECVDAGVRSAVVISAGFKERGAEGKHLEDEIHAQLLRSKMRLVGPPENQPMRSLANHFGFDIRSSVDPSIITAVLELAKPGERT